MAATSEIPEEKLPEPQTQQGGNQTFKKYNNEKKEIIKRINQSIHKFMNVQKSKRNTIHIKRKTRRLNK
jgi:hypothetical protein